MLTNLYVIVVDNEESSIKDVTNILQKFGNIVYVVSSLAEAIKIAENHYFDFIFISDRFNHYLSNISVIKLNNFINVTPIVRYGFPYGSIYFESIYFDSHKMRTCPLNLSE